MINYNFYCTICGTAMTVKKKHARTCSTPCRVALSNIMRYGTEDEEVSEEDRKIANERISEVRGETAPESSVIKKLSKNKKNEQEIQD